MVTDVVGIEPPPLATTIFGSRLDLAARYAGWLAGPGVERGLIGPRETERIWERHLLNCVCTSAVIGAGSSVVDIGSGAGLPGLVLAIARPDLDILLVESMARRAAFLGEAVADLGLSGVTIRCSRAEELRSTALAADVVTARAVAPMDRLVGWAAPLLGNAGVLVALKGDGVVGEVAQALPALRDAQLFEGRLLAVLPGEPDGSSTLQPGLVVQEQGRWDLEVGPTVFTPLAGVGSHPPDITESDRLALLAVFHRSAKPLSGRRSGGLG